MTNIRLRPAGFDARPWRPSSLRAQAQCVYRRTASGDAARENQNGAVRGAEQITELTRQIRALYEDSVVPVAEVARIAGVSGRTLYKYVAKGGWRRRHAIQHIASAVQKRAAKAAASSARRMRASRCGADSRRSIRRARGQRSRGPGRRQCCRNRRWRARSGGARR